mgnify:CR=1 FL=1
MTQGDCCAAVDVGGTFLKSALLTPAGEFIGEPGETRVDSSGTAPEIEASFRGLARDIAKKAAGAGLRVVGVGVSTPGPFDYEGGRYMMEHKYAAIKGISVRPWLTDGLGDVPVCFVHDSTAYMLGLLMEPRISRYRNVAAVMLGTGLGFSLCVDGTILKNPQGGPGVSLYKQPYRDGIAEDYVARRGIIARYAAEVPGGQTVDVVDIAERARAGDAAARRVFAQTGAMLGEILRPVLEQYEVECLVAGGQIARSFDLFEAELRQALAGTRALKAILPALDFTGTPLRGAFAHLKRCVAG